jgi:hypothetical protein
LRIVKKRIEIWVETIKSLIFAFYKKISVIFSFYYFFETVSINE